MKLPFLLLLLLGVAQAAPLTLEEACRRSLLAQPRLSIAQARVEKSQAFQLEAESPWNPRLALDASYTYTTPNAVIQQMGQSIVFTQNHNYLASLRLTQLLWNGGLYANRLEARRWQVAIAQERDRETRLQLQEEAALAFLQAKSAEESLSLNRRQLTQRQAQLAQSNQLYQRGTVARYDVMRTQAELAKVQQELIESERTLQLRRNTLSSLLSLEVEELAELPPPRPPGLTAPENLEERPDVKVARLALQEADARLAAAESQNSPSLSFQTDYQQRNSTAAYPAGQWNTGLVLSWPLYDQGVSQAQSRQVEAELRELQAQAQEVQRLAWLEVRQLRTDLVTRYAAWQAAQAQVTAAEEAARVALIRYQNGLSTQVERLEAEVNAYRAGKEQVDLRYELAAAEARYKRALGQEQLP
ncbi:MAG: TolC family protein [Vulcanimicrobiota bacterium]